MKKMIIFGGTGGLGGEITKTLNDQYDGASLGSKDIDIRSDWSCRSLIPKLNADIVINFAGVNYNGFMHKVDHASQTHMLDVNIAGAVNIAAACLPGMRERGYGRIIMISSVLAHKDVLGTSIYSGTKAFIDRFVRSISNENISKGITANSIQLGYFDGGMTYKLPDPDAMRESLPLKRFGRIDELVNAIQFFINTEYATGVNLKLDGGCI